MEYEWDFASVFQWENLSFILRGFYVTIQLSFLGCLFGTVAGVLLGGIAYPERDADISNESKCDRNSYAGRLITVFRIVLILLIDIVRAIPLLLLILVVYYGLPVLVGVVNETRFADKLSVNAYWSAVIAISINLAAFVADLIRGGLDGISKGSIIAARSLGMSKRQTWWRVTLPEILRDIFPSLVLLWITIVKMSTLASVITVYEVLHSGDAIIQKTYKPLEVMLVICVLFVLLLVPLTWITKRLERTSLMMRRA